MRNDTRHEMPNVVQLEEWIQDKKVPDVEYHSSCVDVDHLENNK